MMGYPMTFRRVISRNRLQDGGYGTKMSGWNTALANQEPLNEHGQRSTLWMACKEIESLNQRWSLLMGDLRRLEADAVDERAICAYLAEKTHVDIDTVAAVLKEFMAW